MKLQFKKIGLDDLLFYVSFTLYFVLSFLSTTFYYRYFPDAVSKLFLVFSILLAVFRELLVSKYSFRSILGIIVSSFSSLVIMSVTGWLNSVALSIVLIYCFRNIAFSKIVKLSLVLSSFLLIVVIISSKVGIIQDYVEVSTNRTRHYLGFRYSLYAPTVMVNIISLILFLKKEAVTYVSLVILFFCNFWIFNQTNSRLTFYTGILLIVFALFYKTFPNFLSRIRLFLSPLVFTYSLGALASYVATIQYVTLNETLLKLNAALGNRIYLSYVSLKKYGFNLLGQKVSWQGNGLDVNGHRTALSYLYVDNLYMQMLQKYGLIFLVLFILIATVVLIKLYRAKEFYLYILVVVLGLHALIDDLIINIHFNAFWFIFGMLMVRQYQLYESDNKKLY